MVMASCALESWPPRYTAASNENATNHRDDNCATAREAWLEAGQPAMSAYVAERAAAAAAAAATADRGGGGGGGGSDGDGADDDNDDEDDDDGDALVSGERKATNEAEAAREEGEMADDQGSSRAARTTITNLNTIVALTTRSRCLREGILM